MSVIQKIREKYAPLSIAVIALSLIGFILMDALSSRSSFFAGDNSVLGKVNSEEIKINEFESDLADLEANYKQQGMDVNENMRQQLIEMLWNSKVEEVLLKNEYNKLGLVFSSIDLDDALYGENPPPVLAQQFKNEQTGAYDPEAARKFINSLRKKKADDPQRQFIEKNLINYLITNGIKTKYTSLLSGATFYPKWLHELEESDNSALANFSYVNIPYTSIPDSTIKVSEDEINAYVKKHSKEYEQEASRSISYTVFDATPTAADSSVIVSALQAQKEEFKNTPNAEQFLNMNGSALAYNDGYIAGSKIQVPNADSIKNLADGAVFGPYADAANFVIAKMIGRRSRPDSVKCRHILIATKDAQSGQPTLSDTIAKKRADSIAVAIQSGSDFAALAKQFSNDPGSKDKGGEYDFSLQQFSNLAKPFAEFIFYKPAKSREVIKTDFGWHYIEVMDQKNFETSYKVAYYAKTIEASSETINTASTAAIQFSTESRDQKTFDKNIAAKKLTPRLADVRANEYAITGLGNARRLIKWIFENDKGAVSEPEDLGDKFVVALITDIKEKGLMDAKSAKTSVEPVLIAKKKADQIKNKIGNNRDLGAIASSFGLSISRADSVSFAAPFINGVGNEPKVLGVLFNSANKGKVTDPIAANSGVFVVKPELVYMKASQSLDYAAKRQQLEQAIKGSVSYRASDSFRKAADVEDNRIKFY